MNSSVEQVPAACDLAGFVLDQWRSWADNRKKLIETSWENAHYAFRGVALGKWKPGEAEGWRSKTIINHTRQKVSSAAALFLDAALSGGQIPFSIAPSPYDEMEMEYLDDQARATAAQDIDDLTRQIKQILKDGDADRAFMRGIWLLAQYGEIVMKRVIEIREQTRWQREQPQGMEAYGIQDFTRLPQNYTPFQKKYEIRRYPTWTPRSPWDIFRDFENPDLKQCRGIYDRQMASPAWLRRRKGRPLFIDDAIERCLGQGERSGSSNVGGESDQSSMVPWQREIEKRTNTIKYLEYWGEVPRKYVRTFEERLAESTGPEFVAPSVNFDREDEVLTVDNDNGDDIEVMICTANQEIVRYARSNPQERPFYRAVWDIDEDMPFGVGVAERVSDVQDALNGIFRLYLDNKRQTSCAETYVIRDLIDTDLKQRYPGQVIDVIGDDVRKAVYTPSYPDVGAQLPEVIALLLRFGDDESGLPRIAQAQPDQQAGSITAFEYAKRLEQAGKHIAEAIRHVDEGLIEPYITDLYDWIMQDPAVTKGKGNFVVKAQGFTTYTDRVQRIAAMQQAFAFIMSHPDGQRKVKFEWWAAQIAKYLDLDISDGMKTEEELAQEQPNPDPVSVAKTEDLRASAKLKDAKAIQTGETIRQKDEQLAIDRALAVKDIEGGEKPPVPAEAAVT